MGNIIFVNILPRPTARDKNITCILKWKSVMEMNVLTKSTNLHAYGWFSGRNTLPRHCKISQLITATFFPLC